MRQSVPAEHKVSIETEGINTSVRVTLLDVWLEVKFYKEVVDKYDLYTINGDLSIER